MTQETSTKGPSAIPVARGGKAELPTQCRRYEQMRRAILHNKRLHFPGARKIET